MPKPGFKNVTIRENVYNGLGDLAKKIGRSVPETILFLLEEHKKMNS